MYNYIIITCSHHACVYWDAVALHVCKILYSDNGYDGYFCRNLCTFFAKEESILESVGLSTHTQLSCACCIGMAPPLWDFP